MRTPAETLLAATVLVGGCHAGARSTGTDGDTGDDGSLEGADSGDADDDPSQPQCENGGAVAAAPLRRLTRWELDNTLRDLLGNDSRPAARLLPDDLVPQGFDNLAVAQNVSLPLVDGYMRIAEECALAADLDALLPCAEETDACAASFVEQFGRRAYRRPLSADEADALLTVFAGGETFDEGIRIVIEAVLQSPRFLYRPELGRASTETGGVVALSDDELATRLSYFIWGSMPDDALLDAAANAELSTALGLESHATRLLADPRAREAVAHFASQWLGLAELVSVDKDAATYPEFDDALAAAMSEETLAFVEHVVFDGEGDLGTMLTADYTLADASIAALYGVDDGRDHLFERLELPPDRRAGVLTHPSLMTTYAGSDGTSPVRRGAFVWTQLMCGPRLEPPPDVDTNLPTVDPDATTREQVEQHASDPLCASCHRLLDPLGFAFEHYDAIGRWRDEENARPIDASGSIAGLDDAEFDGAPELAARLAREPSTHRCFADKTFGFALARMPDQDAEACTIDAIHDAFEQSGGDIRALMLAVVRSDAFRHRPSAE